MKLTCFKRTFLSCTLTLFRAILFFWLLAGLSQGAGAEAPSSSGADLYVSLSGNDQAAGTKAAPFKTLGAARNHIRKLKSAGKLPSAGITVWLTEGTYLVPGGFELTDKDSGTEKAPVVYRSLPGAKVSLVAGRIIPAAAWQPLSASAKSRLHPNADAAKVRELDIPALNLDNASRFAPSNRFSDQWYIIDFFSNGKRQPLAQWPNPEENIRKVNEPGWTTCNGSYDNRTFHYGKGGKPEDQDGSNELDLDGTNRSARWAASLKNGYDLWLKGFWRVPWEPFTMRVQQMDTAAQTIRFIEEPLGGMGSKYSKATGEDPVWRTGHGKEKWRAINLLEEIDYPGEWALDVKDKKIYFYTPVSLPEVMIADTDEPVLHLSGVRHVQFSGLAFSGSRGNGIEAEGSSDIVISGCTLSNLGNNGIVLSGTTNSSLRSNDIFETGGAGIRIIDAGDRRTLRPSGIIVANNHIHHIGQLSFREAIQLASCMKVTLVHNLMHDMPKSAVRTDMVNDCIFEYNEVHNIALGESDNGAFYNYGGWSTYGNVFRYNFVHHINRSNGFYCDDGDSGDLFYNNIVYDGIDAIKFGGGHNNIAKNNLFIRCKDQGVDDRGIARNYKPGTEYEQRLLDMKPLQEPWKSYGSRLRQQYGLKANLWEDILRPDWHPEYPNGCALLDNISIQCGPYLKPKHGDVNIAGNLELNTTAEAAFYDLASLDLRSRNKNILEKFSKLNEVFPQIGLQADSFRKTLPSRKETGGLQNRGKAGSAWDEDQLVK